MRKEWRGDEPIFKIDLADGQIWGFTATHDVVPWLNEFADILKLERAEQSEVTRRILFLGMKPENLPPNHHAPEEIWSDYSHANVYRIWSHETVYETFVELNLDFLGHDEIKYVNMWESLKPLFSYYVTQGGGPVHCALAEFNGGGYIIAAAGDTGKSTCAQRLPKPWTALSDDTALIIKEKEEFHIHPMPTWSDYLFQRGTTLLNKMNIPLKGIFFLEQSEHDRVTPLTGSASIQRLVESNKQIWTGYWSRAGKDVKKRMSAQIFDNVYNIVKKVPCFKLEATLHGEFWKAMEEAMLKVES